MKTKVISTRDFAAIKKMAQIVNPLVAKKASIMKKVNALLEEVEGPEGLNTQIAGMEAGIKAKFLGLGTEQLVKKVVSPYVREDGTPVLDAKTGKQLTKTSWEALPCLVYNEEKNNYTLVVEDDTVANSESEEYPVDEETLKKEEEARDAISEEMANSENPFNM
jgi:hypothetical protein